MPCPHWSKRDNECALLRHLAPSDAEQELEIREIDSFRLDYCLSAPAYATCPTFKRHLIDQAKAY